MACDPPPHFRDLHLIKWTSSSLLYPLWINKLPKREIPSWTALPPLQGFLLGDLVSVHQCLVTRSLGAARNLVAAGKIFGQKKKKNSGGKQSVCATAEPSSAPILQIVLKASSGVWLVDLAFVAWVPVKPLHILKPFREQSQKKKKMSHYVNVLAFEKDESSHRLCRYPWLRSDLRQQSVQYRWLARPVRWVTVAASSPPAPRYAPFTPIK